MATTRSVAAASTENVILIAIDGVRWHEVFKGADPGLIDDKAGLVRDKAHTRELFWRPTPAERRVALMPFLWTQVASQGQVFGDRGQRSLANLENSGCASVESYCELLRGFDDPTRYQASPDNPVNVLEWLNRKQAFRGRVAVHVVWAPLLQIAEVQRGDLRGYGGWQRLAEPLSEADRAINAAMDGLPRIWPEANYDFVIMHAAMRELRHNKPRVMFIALNEADEWAHLKRYDLYLQAIHKSDRFIRQLWEAAQSMPEYAGKTTFMIVTDHGRGDSDTEWTSHGNKYAGSGHVWYALIGPDTPPAGIRSDVNVTSGQVAATVARLLGEDFAAGDARRRPALPGVIQGR